MSNPSKARGTKAETDLLRWLHGNGHPEAVRNPPAGNADVGDLRCECERTFYAPGDGKGPGLMTTYAFPVVIEVKHYAGERMSTALANGTAELEVEKANAGTAHGVLVVRRPGKTDPGEWYAVRLVKDDPEIGEGGK